MTTMIPPTEFNRIVQTSLFPEITVALLNEAELTYSSLRKKPHGNAKRVYPFWKTCQECWQPFPCSTKAQAVRNKFCRTCRCKLISERAKLRTRPNKKTVHLVCPVCQKAFQCPQWRLRYVKVPSCSRHCNGILRGAEWGKHAHKARAAWTAESYASYHQKMSGANNPAWKGGVTVFRKHGNYAGVRYVRCPLEFQKMARKDGYVMEHRLAVATALGRCLTRTEVVHHEDHDPTNNRLANLMLFPNNQAHKLYEARGTPEPIWRGSRPSIIAASSGVSASPVEPSSPAATACAS